MTATPLESTPRTPALEGREEFACARGSKLLSSMMNRSGAARNCDTGLNGRLKICVNCKADAGNLEDSVPYALAVTLEVAEESELPVYEEVRVRIPERMRVRSET